MVNEQTSQVIGKINFVVTSKFKTTGNSPDEKLRNLLKREAQTNYAKGLDKAGHVSYTATVNSVV